MSAINDIFVEGPDQLKQVLIDLFAQSKRNSEACFIHYSWGKQQSLFKFNAPFHILYYDLQGRSATEVVKKSIEDVVRDCGVTHAYFEDVSRQDMLERNKDFFAAGAEKSRVVLSEVVSWDDARVRLNSGSKFMRNTSRPAPENTSPLVGEVEAEG